MSIRERDAAWRDYRQLPDSVSPSADRRTLLVALDALVEAAVPLIEHLNAGHDHGDRYNCGFFAWDELCNEAQERENEDKAALRAAIAAAKEATDD